MLTAPGERRIVGGGEVEAHHPEQGVQEPFGLAQREMVEESQGQGGLDGEIRVPPLPTPPAAPAGRPGRDRLRGQPHRHIAASNEGLIVGHPIRNAILRLITWDEPSTSSLQCGSCGDEKGGPNRPTRRSSGNNASRGGGGRTPRCLAPWRRGRAPWAGCGPDVRRGGHPEIDADHGIFGR